MKIKIPEAVANRIFFATVLAAAALIGSFLLSKPQPVTLLCLGGIEVVMFFALWAKHQATKK